jgi:hypothetical protein
VAVARGNETGRVERAIRYIRDHCFAARSVADLLLAAAKKRGYLAASVGGEEAPVCGAVFGRKAPERKGRRVALSVW